MTSLDLGDHIDMWPVFFQASDSVSFAASGEGSISISFGLRKKESLILRKLFITLPLEFEV